MKKKPAMGLKKPWEDKRRQEPKHILLANDHHQTIQTNNNSDYHVIYI